MSCKEYEALVDGYLDGELDLPSTLKVEAHLPECESCARTRESRLALRSVITGGKLYFKPPVDLSGRVHLALSEANKAGGPAPWSVLASKSKPRRLALAWMSVTAAAVLVAIFAWWQGSLFGPSAENLLAQEVLASHVRSLMANHLTDVPSTDQHTVKPWFSGKLDFSPPVKDLSGDGFELVGGRLDYLNDRPVGALVYQRRKHIINLFVWPSVEDSRQKTVTRQGYNLFRWTQSGMTCWAVSDLNTTELQQFMKLFQSLTGH